MYALIILLTMSAFHLLALHLLFNFAHGFTIGVGATIEISVAVIDFVMSTNMDNSVLHLRTPFL